MHKFDAGNGLFPSQHVSISVLTALMLYHAGYKRPGKFMLLWALLISASVLPTKQHFQVDIVGGFILASKVLEKAQRGEISDTDSVGIMQEVERLCQNLLQGNFDPIPKFGLSAHINSLIFEVIEQAEGVNPFDPVYTTVLKNTVNLIDCG